MRFKALTSRYLPKARYLHNMGLIVRSSAIHAAGCYTTTPVRKGERVAEYSGQRITKDTADALYQDYPVTYLFGLGDGSIVIDGFCTAMFINHSCDGNCETIEDEGRVWVTALRDIPADAEITYDYCLYDGSDDPCTCNCGADHLPRHQCTRRRSQIRTRLKPRPAKQPRKSAASGKAARTRSLTR